MDTDKVKLTQIVYKLNDLFDGLTKSQISLILSAFDEKYIDGHLVYNKPIEPPLIKTINQLE